jgi:hypothetical protein
MSPEASDGQWSSLPGRHLIRYPTVPSRQRHQFRSKLDGHQEYHGLAENDVLQAGVFIAFTKLKSKDADWCRKHQVRAFLPSLRRTTPRMQQEGVQLPGKQLNSFEDKQRMPQSP